MSFNFSGLQYFLMVVSLVDLLLKIQQAFFSIQYFFCSFQYFFSVLLLMLQQAKLAFLLKLQSKSFVFESYDFSVINKYRNVLNYNVKCQAGFAALYSAKPISHFSSCELNHMLILHVVLVLLCLQYCHLQNIICKFNYSSILVIFCI